MVAFDFLHLLLTWWTWDCVDCKVEKVENCQNIHQNVHEKWESPWNVGLQPEGSHCHHLKNWKKLNSSTFGGGGEIRVLETKVAKFAA